MGKCHYFYIILLHLYQVLGLRKQGVLLSDDLVFLKKREEGGGVKG